MSHNTLEKEGGSPAQTLPPSHLATDASLRLELREHVRKLRVIIPVITVSIMALRRQNAELDYEIASVLSEFVCQPLDEELEDLSELLALCVRQSRQREARV